MPPICFFYRDAVMVIAEKSWMYEMLTRDLSCIIIEKKFHFFDEYVGTAIGRKY